MNNTPSFLSRIVSSINARKLDIGIIILIFIFTIQVLEYFGIYPTWFQNYVNDPFPIEIDYGEVSIPYEEHNYEYETNPFYSTPTTTHTYFGGIGKYGQYESSYSKNDTGIFYNEELISADSATFDIIKGNLNPLVGELTYHYAKDKDRVFFDGIEVVGAQPNTFIPLENGSGRHSYGTDGIHVFYGSEKIEGADPATFTILWKTLYEGCGKGSYTKDKNHVYLHEETYLEEGIVYKTYIVPGADPNTFESLYSPYGKDIHGYYRAGMYIGPTIDERLLECNYG